MPNAIETFESSIRDATDLLEHFKAVNTNPPPPSAEVLKRAGLIMACTAWETYVEDRVDECVKIRLGKNKQSFQNQFLQRTLQETLKRFHSPDTANTRKLFADFLGIKDVTRGWSWCHYDCVRARAELNALIKKRGEAAHRSKPISVGTTAPHLIRKEELEKAIRFIKGLVEATEKVTTVVSK